MGVYPRELRETEISDVLASLVRELSERLLAGPSREHRVLQEQLAAAQLQRVTLTGAGLYAYFSHSPSTTTVTPAEMIGGEVPIEVAGLDAIAGSLIKVSGGTLDFLEIYTFGDVAWPDEPKILGFGESIPIPIPTPAT